MVDATTVLTIFSISVLCGCLLMWGRLARQAANGTLSFKVRPRREVPWGLADLFVIVFLFVVSASITLSLAGLTPTATDTAPLATSPPAENDAPTATSAPKESQSFAMMFLLSKGSEVIGVVLGCLYLQFRYGFSLTLIGIDPRKLGADIWLGLKAAFLIIPPVLLIQVILTQLMEYKHPTVDLIQESGDIWTIAAAAITAVCFAPMAEEYLFRLFFQGWLQRFRFAALLHPHLLLFGGRHATRFSRDQSFESPTNPKNRIRSAEVESVPSEPQPFDSGLQPDDYEQLEGMAGDAVSDSDRFIPARWPVFASAFLFAMAHFSQGPAPVPLFFFALGLGFLYWYTQRIVPSIVVHFCLNLWSVALLVLSQLKMIDMG